MILIIVSLLAECICLINSILINIHYFLMVRCGGYVNERTERFTLDYCWAALLAGTGVCFKLSGVASRVCDSHPRWVSIFNFFSWRWLYLVRCQSDARIVSPRKSSSILLGSLFFLRAYFFERGKLYQS